MTFLDVGQGDSIWIRTPDGLDILVDGGPTVAGGTVVSYLLNHGCGDIEYMVLTHPRADPVGALNGVLGEMALAAVARRRSLHR